MSATPLDTKRSPGETSRPGRLTTTELRLLSCSLGSSKQAEFVVDRLKQRLVAPGGPVRNVRVRCFTTVVFSDMQHEEQTLGTLQEIREFLYSFYMVGIPAEYQWDCPANCRLR